MTFRDPVQREKRLVTLAISHATMQRGQKRCEIEIVRKH